MMRLFNGIRPQQVYRAGVLSLLLGSMLTGCAWWDLNPKRVPTALVELKPTLSVKQVWSASVGGSEGYVFDPVIAGNSVYAASENGKVARIEVMSGTVVWQTKTGLDLTTGPGSDGVVTAVATGKGDVLALDAKGAELWKSKVSGEVLTAPLVGNGLVIVRTSDSRFFAMDAQTGRLRWTYQRPQSPLSLRAPMPMRFTSDAVVTGFPGGKLGAIAIDSGGLRWEATVAYPKGVSEIERLVEIAGAPALKDNRVCIAAFQGRIGCFELKNGNALWGSDLSSDTSVATDEEYVFASDEHSRIFAFNAVTGEEVWSSEKLKWRQASAPLSLGRSVVLGDFEGYVHFFSRQKGEMLARLKTDGSAIAAAPVLAGNTLIVQTTKGGLFAFAPD